MKYWRFRALFRKKRNESVLYGVENPVKLEQIGEVKVEDADGVCRLPVEVPPRADLRRVLVDERVARDRVEELVHPRRVLVDERLQRKHVCFLRTDDAIGERLEHFRQKDQITTRLFGDRNVRWN